MAITQEEILEQSAITIMQRVTPFLWFDDNAEEAANFYVSIFKNSKITSVSRYGDAGPGPKGHVMTIGFELDGLSFTGSISRNWRKLTRGNEHARHLALN